MIKFLVNLIFDACLTFAILSLLGLSGCGVGYYGADADFDADAEVTTYKGTDTERTCSRPYGDGPMTEEQERRYHRCVRDYSENTQVVDAETAGAASEFQPAQEPVAGGVN